MKKEKIQEVIIVEGKHDTMALKEIFDCETIETGGTSLSETVFQQIEKALHKTGVIVFTDPDTPGNQIRFKIKEKFPSVKEAFIPKDKAKTRKKVGVEHAKAEDLIQSLHHVMTTFSTKNSDIEMKDLVELGLSANPLASERREYIGNQLHIGTANAKTFLKRLQHYGIQRKEVQELTKSWQKQSQPHPEPKKFLNNTN
ncbi:MULTISPECIES: ribonuclease M5 [Terrabacteria group]|uniref:ribonuclease M5 n=1 Tax=Bacillati TaxID=1783272 RepID=UPI001C6E1699|nr:MULTISPECIES: ribonuclease M5 [Terrabacteria group]MBW9212472.1 ribonuclease M5 [Trueperella sp. zg.1013]